MLSSAAGREARLNWGGPSESRGEDDADDDEEEEEGDVEEELLFDAELFEELLDTSSELELARRSLGRSGSLSGVELEEAELEELLDELLELSSELDDDARRSVGLLPLELTEELPLELFDEEDDEDDDEPELSDDLGSGFMSSVCSDASECSSVVPSRTMEIVDAL